MRRILVLLGFACLSSCAYHPPGSCNTTTDCGIGNRCEQGVCLPGCDDDSQCSAWQQCGSESQLCELRPGSCAQASDCESFEACTENVCVLATNACHTAADCQTGEICQDDHACGLQPVSCNAADDCSGLWASCDSDDYCRNDPPDGNDVLLWGTIAEGACGFDGVAPVDSPERPQFGFGCYQVASALFSDGSLIYIEQSSDPGGGSTVRKFVRDEPTVVDGQWKYPSEPYANDPIIPVAGCDNAMALLVQEDTDAILSSCNLLDWYDSSGALVLSGMNAFAWNAEGQILAAAKTGYVLTDLQGHQAMITGLPDAFSEIDARVGGSGFLIALTNADPEVQQLWEVDRQGQAIKLGDYAPTATGREAGYGSALDRNGRLYAIDKGSTIDTITRYSPDGSTPSVVYSEANAPADPSPSDTPYLKIHASHLVRGP